MVSYKPRILKRTQFGNPILRQKARTLSLAEIGSTEIHQLIENIRYTLNARQYGVGLAAPQVGHSLAISVIDIQPKTTNHSESTSYRQVIINPNYIGVGAKNPRWEGCLSFGSKNSPVFAQTLRYKKIKAAWIDETGKKHQEELSGLPAHVFQHETDHLNGILFPERVKDHTTWMNASEYKKRIKQRTK